jgi:N-acetylmuramoyl-L-alanine amidase
LKANDSRFKGVKDASSYQESGLYKYTVGSSEDYNEIYRLRKSILDKFPEAFIIAFKDGKRMNVQEAIKEFKSNKTK